MRPEGQVQSGRSGAGQGGEVRYSSALAKTGWGHSLCAHSVPTQHPQPGGRFLHMHREVNKMIKGRGHPRPHRADEDTEAGGHPQLIRGHLRCTWLSAPAHGGFRQLMLRGQALCPASAPQVPSQEHKSPLCLYDHCSAFIQ